MRLCELRACSRTIRNFRSIDQVLPDDVLCIVLEQACVVPQEQCSPWQFPSFTHGLSTFSTDTARTLSSVCRRWRRLLSNPVVWSDVSVFVRDTKSLRWVESCLSRSSHMKSMVRIDRPITLRYDMKEIGVLAFVARYRSKIRGLYLAARVASDYDLLDIEMINLERLHLTNGPSASGVPTAAFSLTNFPGLRTLILEGIHVFPAKGLIHITDLTLDSCTFPIDLPALFAVAPIEKLRLRKVSVTRTNITDRKSVV